MPALKSPRIASSQPRSYPVCTSAGFAAARPLRPPVVGLWRRPVAPRGVPLRALGAGRWVAPAGAGGPPRAHRRTRRWAPSTEVGLPRPLSRLVALATLFFSGPNFAAAPVFERGA